MPNFQKMLQSEQTSKLLQDQARLERLRDSPETQRLFELLSRSAGGDLEQAANRAAQGDASGLVSAIQRLMRDPEGQKLIQKTKQSLQ